MLCLSLCMSMCCISPHFPNRSCFLDLSPPSRHLPVFIHLTAFVCSVLYFVARQGTIQEVLLIVFIQDKYCKTKHFQNTSKQCNNSLWSHAGNSELRLILSVIIGIQLLWEFGHMRLVLDLLGSHLQFCCVSLSLGFLLWKVLCKLEGGRSPCSHLPSRFQMQSFHHYIKEKRPKAVTESWCRVLRTV